MPFICTRKASYMQKTLLLAVGLCGLLAVALGAFGAHGLENKIDDKHLHMWEKAVQYQIYHVLAAFMCYLYLRREHSVLVRNAAFCFLLGILCFSGSLYLLATRELTGLPGAFLGPITPIGGFFFIAGWGFVLANALTATASES